MAGDEITMPEDGWVMIHNAWVVAGGDAEEFRELADLMDKWTESIVNIYERQTKMSRDDIMDMMAKETWMNGKQALELGFVDSVTHAVKVAALATDFAKHFKTLPVDLKGGASVSDVINAIKTPRDFEKALREAGVSNALAVALASKAKDGIRGEPASADVAKAIKDALSGVKIGAVH